MLFINYMKSHPGPGIRSRLRAAASRLWCALVAGSLAFVAVLDPVAAAERPFPVRPVRFVVGQAPGGATDLVARAVAQKLTDQLGQPVVVDNRTGAAGSIGAGIVAKSAPDGHTVLIVSSSYSINPSLYSSLPFDPVRDLAPITLIAEAPFLVVVNPGLAPRSIADLVALAKSRPGTLNFGSGGIGSSGHLAGELFNLLAGVRMTHVPYKGAGPALVDVIAGQVQLTFASVISSLGHVKSGKLRALAVTSAKRSRALPELPTVAEAGVAGYATTTWYGALAPAATPPAIIARLNGEIRKALALPEVGQRMSAEGAEPVGGSPDEFRRHLADEMAKWRKVVGQAGIRAD